MRYLKNAQPVNEIDVLDRAFHYGDGCFSTARIRHNRIELSERHLSRLRTGQQKLSLQADLDLIAKSLHVLLESEPELNGTLKIVLSRGVGQRGYSLPEHPADVWVFYYPHAVQDFSYEQIQTGVLQQAIGLTMPNLVGLKTLNRLEQVLLKQEADLRGWPEALVTDVQGTIVEGVSSNCFIRINNTWITPELRYNGVFGVMRAEILQRMQDQGIVCQQRDVEMDEIPHIDSLFFCNALSPMKIATQFEQRALNVDACIELFNRLRLNQMSY